MLASRGDLEMRRITRTAFGVLDHEVTLPSGVTVLNPLRVVPDGDGCEVVFTQMYLLNARTLMLSKTIMPIRASMSASSNGTGLRAVIR